MNLSDEQELALNELLKFEKSKEKFFLLAGSAGTGKTTLLGEYAKNSSKEIILTTPTHKAGNVLQSKSPGYEVSTIHSALGLTLEWEQGETKLVQKAKSKTGNYLTTVVVDEASMIDEEIYSYILDDVRRNNNRYLFVGDHCQLPPPKDSDCPIFKHVNNRFNLKTIIRQAAGNPIIKAATGFRDIIETGIITDFEFGSNEIGSVQLINKDDLITLSKDLYKSDEYKNNSDFVKILAYTNEQCHKYNNYVNKLFKVPDNESFIVGSKIVFNDAYAKHQKIIVPNNTEGVVTGIKKCVKDGIFYDKLTIQFDQDIIEQKEFDVVTLNSKSDYNKLLQSYKSMAIASKSWGKYYALKDMYCDIRPNHAMTVHKSQGSTINNVFIDLKDILKCTDKALIWKLLYTAVTRASNNVYILE